VKYRRLSEKKKRCKMYETKKKKTLTFKNPHSYFLMCTCFYRKKLGQIDSFLSISNTLKYIMVRLSRKNDRICRKVRRVIDHRPTFVAK